jgi:hypothetical protein
MPTSRAAHVALLLVAAGSGCGGRMLTNEAQAGGNEGGSGGVSFMPGAGGTVASGGIDKAGDAGWPATGGARVDAQADVGIGGFVDARIDVVIDVGIDAQDVVADGAAGAHVDAAIDAPLDVASDAPWPCAGTDAGATKCSAAGGVTVVACGQSLPKNVLVADSMVYWSTFNPDDVMRVSVYGGTPTALSKPRHMPSDFAVNATHAYVAYDDGGTIGSVPLVVGPPLELATGQAEPVGVAIDDTYVYWGNHSGLMIWKMLLGGGPQIKVADAVRPVDLGLDADNVYWTDAGLNAVMKVPKTGGTAVAIASATNPGQIAVGGGYVAWMEAHGVTVIKTDGTPSGGYDTENLSCADVAIDGAWVYWTCSDGSTGLIERAHLVPGGAPWPVAWGCDYRSVTVDGTDVYWTSGDGTVARTRKP